MPGMTNDAQSIMAAVLGVWNGQPTEALAQLLAPAYLGHMLGVTGGERDAPAYPAAIDRYRATNPGVVFRVLEQFDADDRLVTRLDARRTGADGRESVSLGINIARFDPAGLLAEEWAIWSSWLVVGPGEPYVEASSRR